MKEANGRDFDVRLAKYYSAGGGGEKYTMEHKRSCFFCPRVPNRPTELPSRKKKQQWEPDLKMDNNRVVFLRTMGLH